MSGMEANTVEVESRIQPDGVHHPASTYGTQKHPRGTARDAMRTI
jgi:hypothetical protein